MENTKQKLIICRAHLVEDCYDGQPWEKQIGEHGNHISEDGTYDGHSIVCDPCYIAIMPFTPSQAALTDEIPRGIETYMIQKNWVKSRETMEDLEGLLSECTAFAADHVEGTPQYNSAAASRLMVEAEIKRRKEEA